MARYHLKNKDIDETFDKLNHHVNKIEKLLEEQTKDIQELKQLFLDMWKQEDEQYGEYRWPYDQDGDILPNVNMSRRLN